jgi:uncharacterized membrane protein
MVVAKQTLSPRKSEKSDKRGHAMTFLLIFYVVAGLLLAGLSVPLILRKIGPNPVYGFRVRQTLEDPAVWYPVNAFAAKGLLCLGLGTSAVSILLYLVPGIDVAIYASVVAAVFLAGLAINLVLSFRYLKSLTEGNRAE